MIKNDKEICKEDNELHKQLNAGVITLQQFNEKKQKSHGAYAKGEKDILKSVMEKEKQRRGLI